VIEHGGKPEVLSTKPPRLTGTELARLLLSLPRPDEEYLAIGLRT
jgi:hypothetical protein